MLARDRIVLGLVHLVGHRAAVLGGDVEETRVGRRQQLDLDCCSFRHGRPAFNKKRAVGDRLATTANSGAKLQIAPEKSSLFRFKKQPAY